jgi:hypothetical protein
MKEVWNEGHGIRQTASEEERCKDRSRRRGADEIRNITCLCVLRLDRRFRNVVD